MSDYLLLLRFRHKVVDEEVIIAVLGITEPRAGGKSGGTYSVLGLLHLSLSLKLVVMMVLNDAIAVRIREL